MSTDLQQALEVAGMPEEQRLAFCQHVAGRPAPSLDDFHDVERQRILAELRRSAERAS